MKLSLAIILFLPVSAVCSAQTVPDDITPLQLQAIISLPLDQAVKQREIYKAPLKVAYARQMAMSDKDCDAESKQGQQPYNVCMGQAEVQADNDFAIFYNNLQMLCHDQDELRTMQASEKEWQFYKDTMAKATHASWPDGTGAPGFASQLHLLLVRDRMHELHTIYGLNIAQ